MREERVWTFVIILLWLCLFDLSDPSFCAFSLHRNFSQDEAKLLGDSVCQNYTVSVRACVCSKCELELNVGVTCVSLLCTTINTALQLLSTLVIIIKKTEAERFRHFKNLESQELQSNELKHLLGLKNTYISRFLKNFV